MEYTLIANSGIQMFTFSLKINIQEKYKLWFHEWYDTENGQWHLDPVYELRTEDYPVYYNKTDLYFKGYLNNLTADIDINDLKSDGIVPLRIDDQMCEGVKGEIVSISFNDRNSKLSHFENVWLPTPYFFKRTKKKFDFGPVNWSRFKLIPRYEEKGVKHYDVLLAFDTRTKYDDDEYKECPVFPHKFTTEIDFELCSNEFLLMDFCSPSKNWSYVDEHLFKVVHPDLKGVAQISGKTFKMSYIASYSLLINFLAKGNLFPTIKLYKDKDVTVKDIDMVVDIGNSRTTALLVEDNTTFNQVRMLQLTDYTNLINESEEDITIRSYSEPFDMRLAFRKVNFGSFGIQDSKQFIYPSFVRLGKEANTLIHEATNYDDGLESLSTYSSPKRYLWDWRPNKEEWRFLVLKDEEDDHVLYLKGLSNQLKNDGRVDLKGGQGKSFHYSRRTLMTFSFLEMLVQARTQINSSEYRSNKTGLGKINVPRRIKRIIVTCPTAMSKIERNALVQCAKDAVVLIENFEYDNPADNTNAGNSIEVIPNNRSMKDSEESWYYDEATCSQLVYMYGEVGYKYKGTPSEFFNLYGKKEDGDSQPSLTLASLDIGAGTSDLMISKYSYEKGDITTITPEPKFYDSYYFAGDDMLKGLINNIMLLDEEMSAFRRSLKDLSMRDYRQKIKDFFGPDHADQTAADRILRKDFNIQYSVPLMYYYLELLSNNSVDCIVRYKDVFSNSTPNENVINGFKERLGIDVAKLEWEYKKNVVSKIVRKEFEPLLKKIATIVYSYACDIVLLSGRPASLAPIREIFLKYYSVSPNRLIVLNNYYVGDWFPFGHNTGYITNPKTIVAMGGLIGHYASELSVLNKFVINLNKLKGNLKSTVNYIESSRDGQPIEYFITPDINRGDIVVSSIPENLKIRQIGMDSYPSRTLYSINFNEHKMIERIRRKNILEGGDIFSDAKVISIVNENIDSLKRKMPFIIGIERDLENKEELSITSIVDKNGDVVLDSNLEIHIQSLGVDEKYWLDSGSFDF